MAVPQEPPVQQPEPATPAPAAPVKAAPAPAAPPPAAPAGPAPHEPHHRGRRVPRTRTGTAWAAIVAAVLLLILLVVFIAQNAHPVDVSFLMLHGRFPLAVALLAAVAGGALITVVAGSLRILQLRRAVPRHAAVPVPAAEPVPATDPAVLAKGPAPE